jgi:hypothetical protein
MEDRETTQIRESEWLIDHYGDDIFSIFGNENEASSPITQLLEPFRTRTEKAPSGGNPEVHVKLNLAGLNRMHMRKLQAKLVQRILLMGYYQEEPDDWESLLEQYSKVLAIKADISRRKLTRQPS